MHVILLCRRTPSFLADAEILSGEVSWRLQVSAFKMAWNSHLLFNSEVTRTMAFGEKSSYFYSDSASSTSYSEKHHKLSEIMLCELGSEKNDATSWAAVRVKCKLCVKPLCKRQRVLWGCSSSLHLFILLVFLCVLMIVIIILNLLSASLVKTSVKDVRWKEWCEQMWEWVVSLWLH